MVNILINGDYEMLNPQWDSHNRIFTLQGSRDIKEEAAKGCKRWKMRGRAEKHWLPDMR